MSLESAVKAKFAELVAVESASVGADTKPVQVDGSFVKADDLLAAGWVADAKGFALAFPVPQMFTETKLDERGFADEPVVADSYTAEDLRKDVDAAMTAGVAPSTIAKHFNNGSFLAGSGKKAPKPITTLNGLQQAFALACEQKLVEMAQLLEYASAMAKGEGKEFLTKWMAERAVVAK
jgi:hypothetical protein